MNDIVIRGKVTIKQGNKVLVKDALNHFVDPGLGGLISLIIGQGDATSGTLSYELWAYNAAWKMYLGSNIAAVTTTGMTALTTPIGTTPGTVPNSQSISAKDGSSGGDNDGVFRAIYHATWNAGTVSGTLGELALYLYSPNDKTAFAWSPITWVPDLEMVSRLSSADTDFSSFAINTAVPLTVDWTVEFAFS